MLTLASALREMFGVQLYKNNARALLSRIFSILNLDWLQHVRCVRGVYELMLFHQQFNVKTKIVERCAKFFPQMTDCCIGTAFFVVFLASLILLFFSLTGYKKEHSNSSSLKPHYSDRHPSFRKKRETCDKRSAHMRNEYMLTIAAANVHQQRYYSTDLPYVMHVSVWVCKTSNIQKVGY